MQPTNWQDIFLQSANQVLETMFFTGLSDECKEDSAEAQLSAELSFRGSSSGKLGVEVPLVTGQLIACNFLGLEADDLSPAQITEVIGELTNMICGSVLSRVAPNGSFELLHPEVHSNPSGWRQNKKAVGYTFGLEESTLALWMEAEPFQTSAQGMAAHRHSAKELACSSGGALDPGPVVRGSSEVKIISSEQTDPQNLQQ